MALGTPPPAEHGCLPITTQGNPEGTDDGLVHGITSVTNGETQRNLNVSKYCLLGRATRILGVQPVQVDGETRGDNDVVVKVSWPAESRHNEVRIIGLATEEGLIRPHLPGLFDHHDLDCDAGQMREALSISKDSPHGLHVNHLLLFEKLNPISSLSGEDFMTAWIQCYRCHFRLRLNGIDHGHITESNLMVHPVTKTGVLNDYELPVLKKKNQDGSITGTEYIDAIPFMALDLLTKEFFEGKTRRIYRHDVESFIWILPWLFLRGRSSQAEELNQWATSDFDGCQAHKRTFLDIYGRFVAYPGANKRPWMAAFRLLGWLFHNVNEESEAKTREMERALESDVDEDFGGLDKPEPSVRLWNDPSEKVARTYFCQFEAKLKERWGYGFEPLPEGKIALLKDEEHIKLD
ncbi:hypothetical protein JAAARDRAFT_204193 [Jaapia argillacea MUCL 33604]|uniref:Fungal-type protein kinase domain-containing protein n=1 Tax=Jaapia argillacea MUCL 33604 TaxID=933084 RepID=A0A067Q432_9AGAM|nr:hypothetical protein JAAARDRAFT_204193 [Jaapia argillacea MUCL 33604]